jgi:plastocyanin
MRHLRIVAPAAALFASGICYAGAAEIDQVGQKFSQAMLAVPRGDAVRFINHDDVTHNINVIDEDDNALDKGLQKPGETIEQRFDKAGKFTVRCSIHPKMKMTVAVK